MELRHLRYFVAVAETESLTLAAKAKLHTSQPSLSHQIRALDPGSEESRGRMRTWAQPAFFRMTFPFTMVVLPWYVSPLSHATL